jgi:hypothetical protein
LYSFDYAANVSGKYTFQIYCSNENFPPEALSPKMTLNYDIVANSPSSSDPDAGEILAASPHSIVIESPSNSTVYDASFTLNVSVNFLESDSAHGGPIVWQTLTSLNYSIDDEPPVNMIANERLAMIGSPVNSGNVTVSGLADGQHKIVLTAVFVANVGNVFMPTYTFTSEPTYFTVALGNTPYETPPLPFPFLPVATAIALAAVVAVAASIAYLKKHKHEDVIPQELS